MCIRDRDELIGIADYSRSLDGIFFIGLPYEINGMLYNMAAVSYTHLDVYKRQAVISYSYKLILC